MSFCRLLPLPGTKATKISLIKFSLMIVSKPFILWKKSYHYCKTCVFSTSFPGSLALLPPGASEGRWEMLGTRLMCCFLTKEIKCHDCCTCSTYFINTDLLYGYVGLVMDSHARVAIICGAISCKEGVVFHKRVMLWSTSLEKSWLILLNMKNQQWNITC